MDSLAINMERLEKLGNFEVITKNVYFRVFDYEGDRWTDR